MDLNIQVKNYDPESKEIEVNLDSEPKRIPLKSLSTELRIYLTPGQVKQLREVEKDLNVSTKEALIELLDLYHFNSPKSLSIWLKRLSVRINQGVNLSFITQLRLIYTFLGHFLKKIKYI